MRRLKLSRIMVACYNYYYLRSVILVILDAEIVHSIWIKLGTNVGRID